MGVNSVSGCNTGAVFPDDADALTDL